MSPDEYRLRELLKRERWQQRLRDLRKCVYRGPADFILRHGELWEPDVSLPSAGPQRLCFGNALISAELAGFDYVEGFALTPRGEVIHHAWNADGEALWDVTWANTGAAYLGVRFSVGRADDATWNGDATILDDYHRGWPILREPWAGEDFAREWEPTVALLALRSAIKDGTGPVVIEGRTLA